MSSLRERCVAQALARLNGPGKPGTVPATTRAGIAAARLPVEAPGHRSIILKKALSGGAPRILAPPERIGGRGGPLVRHDLTLDLEFRAVGDGATPPDAVVEESYAWAVAALAGSDLGGLALSVREGPSEFPELEQGRYPACLMRTQFIVEYAADRASELLLPAGGRVDDPQAPFTAMTSIPATPLALVDGLDATFDESRLAIPVGENSIVAGTNYVGWTMDPATLIGAITAVRHRYRVAAFSSNPLSTAVIQPAIDGLPYGTPRALGLDGTPETFEEEFRTNPATGLPWTIAAINAAKWGWWVELETVGSGSQVSGRVMDFRLQVRGA